MGSTAAIWIAFCLSVLQVVLNIPGAIADILHLHHEMRNRIKGSKK